MWIFKNDIHTCINIEWQQYAVTQYANLIQNSPAIKKIVQPPKRPLCEIQGGGQKMAVIQMLTEQSLCWLLPKATQIHMNCRLLKLVYHHCHFLHIFFTMAFLRATHFFYSWAVLDYRSLLCLPLITWKSTRPFFDRSHTTKSDLGILPHP